MLESKEYIHSRSSSLPFNDGNMLLATDNSIELGNTNIEGQALANKSFSKKDLVLGNNIKAPVVSDELSDEDVEESSYQFNETISFFFDNHSTEMKQQDLIQLREDYDIPS